MLSSQSSKSLGHTALVDAAVAGDRLALERLLLSQYDELAARLRPKLPVRLQSVQAVEDILQQTFLQAFRDIRGYAPRPDASFADWLAKIAEHRLLDAIKEHDRQKRGGDWKKVEAGQHDSCLVPLLDWIADSDPHPSSQAARAEAIHALNVAMAGLEADQREAIRLRQLEGLSLEETAARLKRSPDAVRGLVHRGKQKLRDAMGRASHWLSSTS